MDNKKPAGSNTFKDMLDGLTAKVMRVNSADTSDKIDAAISRVADSIVDKSSSNFAEMMGRVYSDILSQKFNMKSFQRNIFQGYINADRYIRYENAEEIVDCIPYCARALKVIADEVVAPDDINKNIVQIIQEDNTSEQAKEEFSNVKNINKQLKIERHIKELVYDTLKFGDQFVEICDYTSKDIPVTQIILNESGMEEEVELSEREVVIKYTEINEDGTPEFETEAKWVVKPIMIESDDTKDTVDINNVRLIIHDPRYVIKLQSPRFKMCLGYIILPSNTFGDRSSRAFGGGKTNPRLVSLMAGRGNYKDMLGIDTLYMDLMRMVKKHINNKEFQVNQSEVKDMITRSISEFEQEAAMEFKIRFVPPEKMEHFTLSSRRFFPYGEGVFYKTTFAAKLLIALQTAITIKRLGDSSDKRVIYIDTGTPRNARDLIEEMKESLKKRKVSLDSMGSVGSIPSMVTSYEDYYIPTTNGKKYVEFDTLQSHINLRDLADELKYFRDVLVSSLEVPPAYVGLEENLCSALSSNILLTDGRTLTLQEVINEYDSGKQNEVYSYDSDMGMIYTNKIKWAGKTKLNTELIRVHLDNGEYSDHTPDHLFMLRDGTYIEAQNLVEDQSLMPIYIKGSKRKPTRRGNYTQIYHPGLNLWEDTFISFAKYWNLIDEQTTGKQVHHIRKTSHDEKYPKLQIQCSTCGKPLEVLDKDYDSRKMYSCGDPECGKLAKGYNISLKKLNYKTSCDISYGKCIICGKDITICEDNKKKVFKNVCKDITCINTHLARESADKRSITLKGRNRVYDESGSYTIAPLNHKVVRIEKLEGLHDTGDITVEGDNHNFALAAGVFVHNSNKNALSFENILFARTIVSYQTILGRHLDAVFRKLYKFIYNDLITSDINITFSAPRMLQMERESEHMRMVADLITTLSELGINKEYLQRQYLPLDWDKIDEFETQSDMEDKLYGKEQDNLLTPSISGTGGAGGGGMF